MSWWSVLGLWFALSLVFAPLAGRWLRTRRLELEAWARELEAPCG